MLFRDFTAANLVSYLETVNKDNTEDYLGSVLFPSQKQLGLTLSFIKGASATPVTLKPSAYDTDVTLRDRVGAEIIETEMPFFKEAILLKEIERRNLMTFEQLTNQDQYNMMLQRIFDDRGTLIEGADAITERMRMQLLTQGKIAIEDNKVSYEYDYGFNGETNMLTLTGTDTWDKESADPIEDLEALIDNADEAPELMIMNKKTWGILAKHPSLRIYLGKETIITKEVVKDFLEREFGLTVVIYDKKYKTEVFGQSKKFIPDGVVTLAPKEVGTTWYAPTPEEADLMAGTGTSAEVELYRGEIAVTTMLKEDPVNKITKVSQVVLPSAESLNSVLILNVLEGSGE